MRRTVRLAALMRVVAATATATILATCGHLQPFLLALHDKGWHSKKYSSGLVGTAVFVRKLEVKQATCQGDSARVPTSQQLPQY